jgi:hypothetical protein
MPVPVIILPTAARAAQLRQKVPALSIGVDPLQLASGEWFVTLRALRAAGIEQHPRFDLIKTALAGNIRLIRAAELAGFAEMDADAIAAVDGADPAQLVGNSKSDPAS